MTGGAALRVGLALAGLGVASGVGVAVIGAWSRQPPAAPGVGAAYEIASVEASFARLTAALDAARGESVAAMLPEFRHRLGAVIAEQSRGQRLAPAEIEALARLASALDAHTADFGAAAIGDAAAIDRLAATLSREGAALAELAAAARAREISQAARLSEALASRTETTLLAAAGCAALLSLLLAALAVPGGRSGADRVEIAETRLALSEARRAKARFVAMMSHELRTPMNGVLGLLALMKEAGPSPAVARLVDQAERAGLQMNGMLTDMLDVEAREADAPAAPRPEPTPDGPRPAFSLTSLAESMRDLYAPVAQRNGVAFRVSLHGAAPERATGDGRRFQRALSHLVSHVMDRAGVRDVALDIGHDGSECRAELSFDPPEGGAAALGLDEISNSADGEEALAGQGLGPLLARGLVESMGGRLEVSTLDSGRVLILAATPSEPVAEPRPRVRVIAQSRSLGALGAAAAETAGVDVLSLDQASAPDVVLVEAGGAEEERAASESRARWPEAAIVSLGAPDRPELFDSVIAPPLAPETVAKAVDAVWSQRRGAAASEPDRAHRSFAERAREVS